MEHVDAAVIRQHLIDPEICIRCNTCESTCPVGAITHDERNYVVDAAKVRPLHGLHPALPDRQHRQLARRAAGRRLQRRGAVRAGTSCPPNSRAEELAAAGVCAARRPGRAAPAAVRRRRGRRRRSRSPTMRPSSRPGPPPTPTPTSTARAQPEKFVTATVAGNVRVTEVGRDYDTHHIVLDFGAMPFPVLEGQSIGIVPPGARRRRPAAPSAAIFDREPAQRRASRLQQRVADGEAGARGPSGPAGARRREQLPVRSRGRRRGRGHRAVRDELPDAEPSEERDRDDLHRHRQRADAGDDRVAAAPAQVRQVRGRQADAVLRRADQGGAALFRPARKPAEGLHRHQLRLQPHAGTAQALRSGSDARRARPTSRP